MDDQQADGGSDQTGRAGRTRKRETSTSAFGTSRREGHDSSAFYQRFSPPNISDDETVNRPADLIDELGRGKLFLGSIDQLANLPENSVALVVTSPPYFVGKEYELAVAGHQDAGDDGTGIPATYLDFLDMLRSVFTECRRVLEPGGRMAINVANLGRKPYRSLSADVISILQDDLGLLLRGEVIWEKASGASGSCAWGSFAKASNPVLRDLTERVIIASKGRFSRALTLKQRRDRGLPHESTLTNDEFVDVTRDVWRMDAESATRIGHPAPFPIDLPRRLIDLYTYKGDLVVDPFAGSGTTLVATARAGRIGIGYDTDNDYVELSQQRLDAELTGADARKATDHTHDVPSFEDRQEFIRARAIDEGKKAGDIAGRHLEEAGFATIKAKVKHPGRIIELDFSAHGASGELAWWIEVAGGLITSRPGLQRIDAVWKLLGRLSLLNGDDDRPVLVLTPSLPKPGSPADKALRAAGPGTIFDVIELYDPAGMDRLSHYARQSEPAALPGFWEVTLF